MIQGPEQGSAGHGRTARRDKVTEEAGGQIMEDLVHLFGIYSE